MRSMGSSDWMFSDKIQKVDYLHPQRCDGADTSQFDSTDECFKTVEYEHKRSTELRDIARKCLYFPLESACSTAGDTLDLM